MMEFVCETYQLTISGSASCRSMCFPLDFRFNNKNINRDMPDEIMGT